MSVRADRPKYWLHALLFFFTILTTLFTGMLQQVAFMSDRPMAMDLANLPMRLIQHPQYLLYGLPYSFTILMILLAHEMGHYVACKYYGISATLPFFLPAPIGFVGTFGALIRIKSSFPSKKALFDVGIAGPIAGFLLAVPALAIGISASKVADMSSLPNGDYEVYIFGEPLLYKALVHLLRPGLHGDLQLHPIGFAAWFGIFATAFNLLPISQLDGGHVVYALTGRRFRLYSRLCWACMMFVGVMYSFVWFLPGVLIFFILGLDHPPTTNEDQSVGRGRLLLFLVAILIFALSFMPVPFTREFVHQ